ISFHSWNATKAAARSSVSQRAGVLPLDPMSRVVVSTLADELKYSKASQLAMNSEATHESPSWRSLSFLEAIQELGRRFDAQVISQRGHEVAAVVGDDNTRTRGAGYVS